MGWAVNATPPAASLLVSTLHVAGWAVDPSRQVRIISSPPGFELQTDQPTGTHYTDHITLTAVKLNIPCIKVADMLSLFCLGTCCL